MTVQLLHIIKIVCSGYTKLLDLFKNTLFYLNLQTALEAQTAVQNINNKVETMFSPTLTLFREQSVYYPDDRDMRTTSVQQLEKNLNTIQDVLHNFSAEREEICDHFRIAEDESISEYFKNMEQILQDKLKMATGEASETEERLLREIKNLNDAFELRESISKTEKEGFNQDLAAKEQEIADLREVIHRQKLRLKTDSSVSRHNKGVQAVLLPPQRECCIQVDIPTPSSVDSGISEDECQGNQSPKRIKPLDKPRITVDLTGSNYKKKRALKEQRSPRSTSTDPAMGGDSNNGHSKSRLLSMSHDTMGSGRESKVATQDNASETSYSLLHVRNQVVTLAQKLERAKWDTEEYEQKLAMLKFQTNTSPTNEYHVRKQQSNKPHNSIEAGRKWASSEGFLAGSSSNTSKIKIKFDRDEPKHRKSNKSRTARDGEDTTSGSSVSSVGMRCLRCDITYSSKDNSKVSCRYHPKGKQKIEKYDPSGKLLKVSIIWECCMQGEGAGGCSVGEHI